MAAYYRSAPGPLALAMRLTELEMETVLQYGNGAAVRRRQTGPRR